MFGIFLYRQAMLGVPDDLIEAGRIDGCGEFRIYLKLVMPLVRPMTGAFCLITFLGMWNSFLPPNVYLQTQAKLPLPVVLNQYIGEYVQQYGVFLAGTLIAILPPAVLFLALHARIHQRIDQRGSQTIEPRESISRRGPFRVSSL